MRWVVIIVAAAIVGLLTYGVVSEGTDTTLDSKIASGEFATAPSETLPTLGTETSGAVKDYRGQLVLVNFWASWCKPCRNEAGLLEGLQDKMKGQGTVLGINSRDASSDGEDFVQEFDLTYPSLRDGSGDYSDRWGVNQLPESFLVDAQGKVVAAVHGEITQAWIDTHVTPRLKTP